MRLEGYKKNKKYGFFLNNETTLDKIYRNILKINYILSDLDGTLYPSLLVSDLTLFVLKKHGYLKKYSQLKNLLKRSKKLNFFDCSSKFINILGGLPLNLFEESLPLFINNCYPYSFKFFKKIGDKKTYLVSLTSDFVAKNIAKKFGFNDYYSMNYGLRRINGIDFFNGEYLEIVKEPEKFKTKSLEKFKLFGKEFLMIGNSYDDFLLFKKAKIRIGVRPHIDIIDKIKFDLILMEKKDPWKEFYNFLFWMKQN